MFLPYHCNVDRFVGQVEVGSIEHDSLARELRHSKRQCQELRRLCSDLHQVIDSSSANEQPQTALKDLQQCAGSLGLKAKAVEYDALISWVEGCGGKETLIKKVAQAETASPLLQRISEPGQLGSLTALLDKEGGLENHLKKVTAAEPMLKKIADEKALDKVLSKANRLNTLLKAHGSFAELQDLLAKTKKLLGQTGSMEGLSRAVSDATKARSILEHEGGIEGLEQLIGEAQFARSLVDDHGPPEVLYSVYNIVHQLTVIRRA